ncbi:uncharacterized protein SOCE26_076070 [Sorangium cellulosum]|uniref:Acyl-CoA dehydrogenase/oxidase N-terminal domain-containing protein n=1 Tax=Sorangium cellulosum TaxID=56 RepID=A0A2L0F3G9_SORCE|nr:uncharacterized protein SOCE26_076070 [Sorangium cellulosum]
MFPRGERTMTAAGETTPTGRDPATLTHAEAVERARGMADDIRARAAEAEALRHIPKATIRGFIDAGLVRLLTPRAFGGHELSLDTFADVTIEIARADASTGWCFSFLNIHSWLLATFPVEAQEDVWRKKPDAALVDVNVPAGQASRVEGGYRLSGDWPWASGVHHCDWAMLAGVVSPEPGAEGGPPDMRLFLVPREDMEIRDTWHVAGLRGTGSHNVVVKDRLVPQHRTARMAELSGGQAPGSRFHTNPLYRLPMITGLAASVVAAILGASQGAYQRWRGRDPGSLHHVQPRAGRVAVPPADPARRDRGRDRRGGAALPAGARHAPIGRAALDGAARADPQGLCLQRGVVRARRGAALQRERRRRQLRVEPAPARLAGRARHDGARGGQLRCGCRELRADGARAAAESEGSSGVRPARRRRLRGGAGCTVRRSYSSITVTPRGGFHENRME